MLNELNMERYVLHKSQPCLSELWKHRATSPIQPLESEFEWNTDDDEEDMPDLVPV